MKKTVEKKEFVSITVITAILGISGFAVIKTFFPDHYFNGYPTILLFFYFYELCYAFAAKTTSKKNTNLDVMIFIASKGIKLLSGTIFITIFSINNKNDAIIAFITFIIAYIISIIFESIIYTRFSVKKRKV